MGFFSGGVERAPIVEKQVCVASYDASKEPWLKEFDQVNNRNEYVADGVIDEADVEIWMQHHFPSYKIPQSKELYPFKFQCSIFKADMARHEFITKYAAPEMTRTEPLSTATRKDTSFALISASTSMATYLEEAYDGCNNMRPCEQLAPIFIRNVEAFVDGVKLETLDSIEQTNGKLAGCGIASEKLPGSYPVIKDLNERLMNSSAFEQLIDKELVAIDGVDTFFMNDAEIRHALRGTVGSKAVVTVRSPETGSACDVVVERGLFQIHFTKYGDSENRTFFDYASFSK